MKNLLKVNRLWFGDPEGGQGQEPAPGSTVGGPGAPTQPPPEKPEDGQDEDDDK